MKLVVALALSGSLFVSLACGPGDDDAGIGPSELQEWDCEMTATCRAASATVEFWVMVVRGAGVDVPHDHEYVL